MEAGLVFYCSVTLKQIFSFAQKDVMLHILFVGQRGTSRFQGRACDYQVISSNTLVQLLSDKLYKTPDVFRKLLC